MSEALSDIHSDKLASCATHGTVEGAVAFPPYATHPFTDWVAFLVLCFRIVPVFKIFYFWLYFAYAKLSSLPYSQWVLFFYREFTGAVSWMSGALSDIPSDKLTSYATHGTVEGALAFPPYATHALTGWLFWFCASELFLYSKYYIVGYTLLMPNYLRYRIPGGCYFFTVNLLERNNTLLIDHIALLRESVQICKQNRPFHIDAWVVLPEHMHCIWTLPEGDDDFSNRWKTIKIHFSKNLPKTERRSKTRVKRGERGIWQRRFWEHAIRDNRDYENHMDYIHFNPVKHGWVSHVIDWPFSSFHRYVDKNIYPADWSNHTHIDLEMGEP